MLAKKRLLMALLLLLVGVIGYSLPLWLGGEKREGKEGFLRLHVVAASDGIEDQRLKLKVRDAILAEMREDFEGARDFREAREIAARNLGRIEATARRVVQQEGYDYPVQAVLGRFSFPARRYGPLLLPAGQYEAVKVVLGEGQGSNWWCVLFPPLCLQDLTVAEEGRGSPVLAAAKMKEDMGKVKKREKGEEGKEGVKVRFKLLEWLEEVKDKALAQEK
ncbi:MAG: stage sporulation protein [Eubacteriales bacterium]|nr:stage sporulation protein [Eubacteriales bacterium]